MKFQSALISRIAAAALAIMVAQGGSAWADDDNHNGPNLSEPTATTETAAVTQSADNPVVTSLSVQFNPRASYIVIGGLGGLALLLSLFAAQTRMRASWLRAAAAGTLTLALANPEFLQENREMLPTDVMILLDRSASQMLDGRDQATMEAHAALVEQLSALAGVHIRTVEVGHEAGSDGTNLFGALETNLTGLARDRLGAVIALTDGQIHDIFGGLPDGVPFHALISGHEEEFDRRIVIESAPAYGIVNEDQLIRFRVVDDGLAPGTHDNVRVVVSRDGEALSTLSVTPGETVEVTVNVPHAGTSLIALEAEALEGELTDVNNRVVAPIEGIRERMRVLLMSGQPSQSHRTWRTLLKSDPAIDLVHFTILRPPEVQDGTPLDQLSLLSIPTRELFAERINDFDVILLDEYQYRGILPRGYFENIADFVRGGGALGVITGPEYLDADRSLYRTPLAEILPAAPGNRLAEGPFRPEISEMGERHPVTRGLGGENSDPARWGQWFRMVEVGTPSGTVLMEGADSNPLMILNREQDGRVAMLLSDQSWLWARGHEGGGPHADMMRRMTHWLLQEPALEEEALRMRAVNGQLTVERQTMSDEVEPVTVRAPSGAVETVTLEEAEPGLWRATVPAAEIGLYSAEHGEKQTLANAGPANPREYVDTRSTTERLQPVADQTGGQVTRMMNESGAVTVPQVNLRSSGEMHGRNWIGVQTSDASILRDATRQSVFTGLLGLALLLGALSAVWYREGDSAPKRSGRKAPKALREEKPTL